MRKILLFSLVAVAMMAVSCQNAGNKGEAVEVQKIVDDKLATETSVRQRVEQMLQMDVVDDLDKMLTPNLLAQLEHAESVFYAGNYFMGFNWNTGLLDQCSPDAAAQIKDVRLTDATHACADMRWYDEECYDLPYTLNLVLDQGQWKIDDVAYPTGGEGNEIHTLRDDCEAFFDMVSELYAKASANETMEYLLGEEPTEEDYTNPVTIFYNSPQAVENLVAQMRNNHELFKKNSDYTDEMGQQIEAMIARIESHLK
ncbi:MAG: hypothetical protein IJ057_12055 [Bacteroidales bacterium]|nr:hypothetical protein [Bacteroidales bacterium]